MRARAGLSSESPRFVDLTSVIGDRGCRAGARGLARSVAGPARRLVPSQTTPPASAKNAFWSMSSVGSPSARAKRRRFRPSAANRSEPPVAAHPGLVRMESRLTNSTLSEAVAPGGASSRNSRRSPSTRRRDTPPLAVPGRRSEPSGSRTMDARKSSFQPVCPGEAPRRFAGGARGLAADRDQLRRGRSPRTRRCRRVGPPGSLWPERGPSGCEPVGPAAWLPPTPRRRDAGGAR